LARRPLAAKRLIGVIPITVGLIVELLALRFGGFGFSWKRAALVDVVMNAVSTAVGIVLIPALGLAGGLFFSVLYEIFNIGSLNASSPGTWAATFVMAVLTTTAIEAAVVSGDSK